MATATMATNNEEETRYESFFDNGLLRLPATCPHSPREFAKKGFFYRGKEARDEVVCYTCGVGISEWEPHDDIDSEHRRFRSICPLLKKTAHCTDDEEPKRQDLSSSLAASLALASSESKAFSASSVARDRAAVHDGESGVRHGETEGEYNIDDGDSLRCNFVEENIETDRRHQSSRGVNVATRPDTFRGRETIATTALATGELVEVERPESEVYSFESNVLSALSAARERTVSDDEEGGIRHTFFDETEAENNDDGDSRFSPRSNFVELEKSAIETEANWRHLDSREVCAGQESETTRIVASAVETPKSDVPCFDDWETSENSALCSICTIRPRNRVAMPCGHVFCAQCLDWAFDHGDKCLLGCGSKIEKSVAVSLPTSKSDFLAMCLQCRKNEINVRFRCGHSILCNDCAKTAVKCMYCMTPVENRQVIYFS